jgi:hypothetical protein
MKKQSIILIFSIMAGRFDALVRMDKNDITLLGLQ